MGNGDVFTEPAHAKLITADLRESFEEFSCGATKGRSVGIKSTRALKKKTAEVGAGGGSAKLGVVHA
jgi:hypothetical protein